MLAEVIVPARPAARLPRAAGAWLAVAMASVALGWVTATSPGRLLAVIAFAAGAAAALSLSFGRLAWCAAAVVGLAAFGWTPEIAALGPFHMRTVDAVTALLVFRAAARRPEGGSVLPLHRLVVFLAVMGITVLLIARNGSAGFSDSAVSWMRLAVTASLAWLVPVAIRTIRDIRLVLNVFAAAAAATVIHAVATMGALDRASGLLGPNALGMVAGILLVTARYSPTPSHRLVRVMLAVTGLIGLVLAKSIGSTAATGAAFLAAGVISSRRGAAAGSVPLRVGGRLLVAGAALFLFMVALRPGDLPGSERFAHSSTALRLSVGYAGLQIFADHPLIGVGWQQSGRPEIINDPGLIAAVDEKFPERHYADLGEDSLRTVHNMYVQVLAEGGIIGFAALAWLLWGVAVRIRMLLVGVQDPWLAAATRFLAIALVLVVVWWNDNPLFGGQVESILAFSFLGVLAAIPRVAASLSRPGAGDEVSPT